LPEYVRRALSYPQMDMDYTFWQMLYLCFAPSRVYRTTKYHRQTKNQWARDDPAFVALMVYFMAVAALGYSVSFHRGVLGFLKVLLYSIVVDFFLVGAAVATVAWWLANTYLRVDTTGSHTTEQRVEWMYAFDVHCNAFFPLFMLVYVVQYMLVPFLLRSGFFSRLLSNLLYTVALSYYCYVMFLGYDILPFLQHTVCFLYPVALIAAGALLCSIVGVNFTQVVMRSYFG